MTNFMIVCINLVFLIINFILLPGAMQIDRNNKGAPLFTLFYVALIFWQICEMLMFCISDLWWIRYLYDLKLIGVAHVAVLFALLIVRFFRLTNLFTKRRIVLLWIIPIVTTVLALTTMHHTLLRTSLEVVQLRPLLHIQNERGPWFFVHTAYCTILVIVMMILSIIRFIKVPKVYRTGPFWLIIVISILIAGSLFDMIKLRFDYLDFFLLGTCMAGLMYYISYIVNDRSNYLYFEQREVFDYMDKAIFILDDTGQVMDANQVASKWLISLGAQEIGVHFDDFLHELEAKDKLEIQSLSEDGVLVYINENDYIIACHMERYPISSGSYHGYAVTLEDLTRSHLASQILQREYMRPKRLPDSQPYKVNYYQNLVRCVGIQDTQPLGVIVCRIENLRALGVEQGKEVRSQLVEYVSKIIHDQQSEDACLFKINKHKFILLLPGSTQTALQDTQHKIYTQLKNHPDIARLVEITLGSALKDRATPDLYFLNPEMDSMVHLRPSSTSSAPKEAEHGQ